MKLQRPRVFQELAESRFLRIVTLTRAHSIQCAIVQACYVQLSDCVNVEKLVSRSFRVPESFTETRDFVSH